MIGWAVPFIWAVIWAAITVPWVRAVMHRERTTWEEESNIMTSTMMKPPAPPTSVLEPGTIVKEEGNRESSTSAETAVEHPQGSSEGAQNTPV